MAAQTIYPTPTPERQGEKSSSPFRVIRCPQVQFITGLSRTGIYTRIDKTSPGYDPTFPRPINLGGRSVGWVLAEVESWVAQRINARSAR